MNPGVTEEVGKTTRSFFDALKDQPLSLALVMVILVLLGFLFYSGTATLTQRRETVDLIVAWQRESDKLMSSCVSADIMKMVLDALERDRELYRRMLPPVPPTPTPQSDPRHILFQPPP